MSVPDKSIDPRLLSAAKKVFLKKGFEMASLAEICQTAGVTTGALYKRYSGKEELFAEVVSGTIGDMETYASSIKEIDLSKCAAGTRYSNFHHEWSAVTASLIYRYYQEAKKRGLTAKEISLAEMSILAATVWTLYYEPFIYDYSWEQMEDHARTIHDFINWHRVFGMKKPD